MQNTERLDSSVPVWILHVDGSSNQQGCGAGLVLTTPDGAKITADFAANDASMSAYLSAAHQLLQKLQAYEIRQIPRSENSHADALSRLASAINDKVGRKVPVEILSQPSTEAAEGLDLIDLMPQGKGQVKYVVVAVDYFTKCVEAEALATITETRMKDFIWTHICCRFGIPYAIITDNGRQFDSEVFRQFCTRLKINMFFASPAHPQSNGHVEAINKIIKKLLKRHLDKAKGAWSEKLPEALWAIQTSYRTATGETPFSLVFGSEAVVPVEIGEPSYRTKTFTPKANEEALALSLDLIEERRAQANLRRSLQTARLSVLRLKSQIPFFSKSGTELYKKSCWQLRTPRKEPSDLSGKDLTKSSASSDREPIASETQTARPSVILGTSNI
ncbi:PREDICTED: uncharacterized protein LOC107880934 [Prunus mume]|uniref:Uncharacterized protein LOC107880934 n=1 Tax=Prunus mume TaxID=102107 RepID=A0ABM1LNN6_PRUMU|nr:PREDICTED: uncharacterized protein LOC107880934 [Prunus mume]